MVATRVVMLRMASCSRSSLVSMVTAPLRVIQPGVPGVGQACQELHLGRVFLVPS